MADSIISGTNNAIEEIEAFSYPNVALYFIDPRNQVVTPFKVTTVRIITLNENGATHAINRSQAISMQASTPAYIGAEQWFYPLVQNLSIVFRTAEGHYIFPDTTSGTSGIYCSLKVQKAGRFRIF